MLLVIDQAHLQDVLTAVTNSKLRVQTTQVEWQHFPRGASIKPPDLEEKESRPEREKGRKTPAVRNVKPGAGGGAEEAGAMMMKMMGGAGAGRVRGGYNPAGGAAGETGSEDLASNLVEVAIYGIASLYERPTKGEAAEEGGSSGTPAKK